MTAQTITPETRAAALAKQGSIDIMYFYTAVQELGVDPESQDDREFDTEWIYCSSHMRVHVTGWCTAYNGDKLPLFTQGGNTAFAAFEAQDEARSLGFELV